MTWQRSDLRTQINLILIYKQVLQLGNFVEMRAIIAKIQNNREGQNNLRTLGFVSDRGYFDRDSLFILENREVYNFGNFFRRKIIMAY